MDIKTLSRLTIAELTGAYRDGSADPVAVMEATFAQIAAVNGRINALYDLQAEGAMAAAIAARDRYARGAAIGVMDGVPVTIKDSVHAVGMVWRHGSAAHGDGVVGTVDAPPAQRLKAAGAIIIGKCTMPDYGLSGSGVSSAHGVVRNPWGLGWNTGGSSAGAGASLAAGIGMMSVGSDIAGSVRLPASHCGVAALKPTQGMVPHTPASDVRSAGPMTRSARDLAFMLRVLGGLDDADRFSVPVPHEAASLAGARVGFCADFGFGPAVEAAVQTVFSAALKAAEGLAGPLLPVATPYDFDAYLPMDDSFKLRGWLEYTGAAPHLRDETPQELRDWFGEARAWDGARLHRMQKELEKGVNQTARFFEGCDLLLTPVMPLVNWPAEERGPIYGMPLRHCTFTAPFNQSGHPAAVICGGFDARGLPVGVQIVGRRFDDLRVLAMAEALEHAIWSEGLRDWPLVPAA
ncbi:MAG: hypothetical protein KDE03_01105 [Rhodobacteraceae bacterium]|nr:hypothetical protein [Paracoccaceae bacterium]